MPGYNVHPFNVHHTFIRKLLVRWWKEKLNERLGRLKLQSYRRAAGAHYMYHQLCQSALCNCERPQTNQLGENNTRTLTQKNNLNANKHKAPFTRRCRNRCTTSSHGRWLAASVTSALTTSLSTILTDAVPLIASTLQHQIECSRSQCTVRLHLQCTHNVHAQLVTPKNIYQISLTL